MFRTSGRLTTKEKIEGFNTRFTIAGVTDLTRRSEETADGSRDSEWITVPVIFQCFHIDRGEDGYVTTIHREPSNKFDADQYNPKNCMIVTNGGWGDESFTVFTTSIFNDHMEQTIKYDRIHVLTAIDNDRKECSFYQNIDSEGNPIIANQGLASEPTDHSAGKIQWMADELVILDPVI